MIVSVNELIENDGDTAYQQYLMDCGLTTDELDAVHEYAESLNQFTCQFEDLGEFDYEAA
jgi:hypothetical protein